jgi:hypothetical protein
MSPELLAFAVAMPLLGAMLSSAAGASRWASRCKRTACPRPCSVMANLVALGISVYATGYFRDGPIRRCTSGPFGCCSGPR